MTTDIDPYTILGVSLDTTPEEIEERYQALSRRLHPDINDHAESQRQFRDITDAYELLTNVRQKNAYDERRKNHAHCFFHSTPFLFWILSELS